jgi:hypothetical protein
VKDYFTAKAIMKFTLWKDNQRNEAKPFGGSHSQLIHFGSFIHPDIRDRRPYPAPVFSCHYAIWCQIHDALARWCTRATSVATPRSSGVCCSCLDIPIHQRVHRHPPGPSHRPRSHHSKHRPFTTIVILAQIRPPAIRCESPREIHRIRLRDGP